MTKSTHFIISYCTTTVRTRHKLLGWAAEVNALVLSAHLSGHSALEIEDTGNGFAIKKWAPFSRY